MFSSLAAVTVLAALAPQALATLYITSPVASTVCKAGTNCPVAWNDDGTAPPLATIGACTVGLYVGSQFTQIQLQPLGDVSVAAQASATFIPNPEVGGNSDLYFLRFTSTTYQVNGVPWEGFSAKFTIQGMTGTFNATESSLMYAPTSGAGGATSPAASTPATSTPASSTPATSAGPSSTIVTTTKAGTSSTQSKAASSPTTSSAALPVIAGSSSSVFVGVAAVAVSAVMAAFAL